MLQDSMVLFDSLQNCYLVGVYLYIIVLFYYDRFSGAEELAQWLIGLVILPEAHCSISSTHMSSQTVYNPILRETDTYFINHEHKVYTSCIDLQAKHQCT